jgi:hypothetical protein
MVFRFCLDGGGGWRWRGEVMVWNFGGKNVDADVIDRGSLDL